MLPECLQCNLLEEISKSLNLSSLEIHKKIHQVTSSLLCFPIRCATGLQICRAWSVKQSFSACWKCLIISQYLCLLWYFFPAFVPPILVPIILVCLDQLSLVKTQTSDSFFYLTEANSFFFSKYFYSASLFIHLDIFFVAWQLADIKFFHWALCSALTVNWVILLMTFFLKATRVAAEGISMFVHSWSCCCDLTSITGAPGHSDALHRFGRVGDFSLCVSHCPALQNLWIHLGVAKVTSVWLSKHDSLVTWSSGDWIYSQPACSCAFLRDIWTTLSLFSVSSLKVKESPWFQHPMLLVDT